MMLSAVVTIPRCFPCQLDIVSPSSQFRIRPTLVRMESSMQSDGSHVESFPLALTDGQRETPSRRRDSRVETAHMLTAAR
jgi:hypothetical protein